MKRMIEAQRGARFLFVGLTFTDKKKKKLTTKLPRGRLVATKNPGGFLLRGPEGWDPEKGEWRLYRDSNPVPSKPPSGRNDSRTPMAVEPLVPAKVSVVCPEGGDR